MPCRPHVQNSRAALLICRSCEYARTGTDDAERACSDTNATELALDALRCRTA